MEASEPAAPFALSTQGKVAMARRAFFSAGRRLRDPNRSDAENRALFGLDALPHGHNYTLSVYYGGAVDNTDGMIANLSDLKPLISRAIAPLEGAFLDADVTEFHSVRPTAENLVNFIWNRLPPRVSHGLLQRVVLQEGNRTRAEKTPDFMRITRSYEFAAAHRLHVPEYSEADNAAMYGKCNNAAGHGHNYGLEVTLEGTPDAVTGTIIAPRVLDELVEREIIERFDHKHLNEDCAEFENLVPTTENLSRVIFDILHKALAPQGYKLAKIGLHETPKNYFEIEAE